MKHEQPKNTIPAYLGVLVSQTIAQPIQWLWQDRIPQGRLTLLEGESGIGKSLLALHIAASVSNAPAHPGTTSPTKGGVIIITSGSNDTDTIKPRLQAAGADLSRILLLSLPPRFTPTHSIAPDLEYIEAAIKDIGASLVIIDPLATTPDSTKPDQTAPPSVHIVHSIHTPISDSLSDISHPPVHTVHSVHTPISDSLPAPLHTPIPIHTLGIWLSEIESAIPIQERAT